MRAPLAALAAAVLGLCAGLAVGCGESEEHLLPSERAAAISDDVDAVADAVDAGECRDARRAAERVRNEIRELGPPIDARLRDNLRDWARHLNERVPADCEPREPAETTPETTPTAPPTITETTPPTQTEPRRRTTPTQTVPPPTTTPTQTQPPPTVTPPPDGGEDGEGTGGTGADGSGKRKRGTGSGS